MKKPALIVHIIHRLSVGGLENGLINIINNIPEQKFRHVIICLKEATEYKNKILNNKVEVISLHKKDGHDFFMFYKLYCVLRKLSPDIVHTRNLSTIEYQLSALLAGVKYRIHSEHGWDIFDPRGEIVKYQILRKIYSYIIQTFISLSIEIKNYLINKVHIPENKIRIIINGVNCNKFKPMIQKSHISGYPFSMNENFIVVGTIGRMHGVKDQINLVKAFIYLITHKPQLKYFLRLVMIGDGPLRNEALNYLLHSGVIDLVWLPGERHDIAEILNIIDIFVLPSYSEGISNVILEAMATGIPVIATNVGGNPELVINSKTGFLIEPKNPEAIAMSIEYYINNPDKIIEHGKCGFERANNEFSLDKMINSYIDVYVDLMQLNK